MKLYFRSEISEDTFRFTHFAFRELKLTHIFTKTLPALTEQYA